nr:S1 RNA-binding domain-containing protein [Deltaproteobacteria bacterium]
RFVEDLTTYIGQKLTFRITRYEPRNLVLSRRVLVEEEKAKIATETRKTLEPGLVVRGKIVGFKPFGAFVDIGGMEGMLHVSELGYSRVEKPEDVLSMGQEVDVVVLKVEQTVEKGRTVDRVSLSLKALATDPWRDAVAMFKEGQRLKGKVTRLMAFGAFVEIAPGIEGLVHISELGTGRRINHPKEVVSPAQEVEATILRIDVPERKIALSLATAEGGTTEEVAEATKAQPGAKFGTFGDLLQKLKR